MENKAINLFTSQCSPVIISYLVPRTLALPLSGGGSREFPLDSLTRAREETWRGVPGRDPAQSLYCED